MKNKPQAHSVYVLCLALLLAACRQQETGSRLGLEVPLRIMPMGDSITEGLCDTQDTCEEPAEWMIPTSGDGVEACRIDDHVEFARALARLDARLRDAADRRLGDADEFDVFLVIDLVIAGL